jgi:PEP-CTERM/exosortase A-associated glycosyltransferase
VLDHSWPVLDGYSRRSRSIIAAQKCLGFNPVVLTGPLHNLDDPAAAEIDLDTVHYFRVPNHSGIFWQAIRRRWPLFREAAVVLLLEKRIRSLLLSGNIDVVHAHSPALCGLAAARVARERHLPFVYEIRSFWEDGMAQSPSSLRYRLARSLETYIVMRADAVVGIAEPILKDLASRGVPESRLFLVPNGVDAARFTPRQRDAALAVQLGVRKVPTLGFLGTLFPWEGVPWLVRAAAALRSRGLHFKLLIVGDGAQAESIQAAIRQESAQDFVSYLGRVPHQEVERYYSVMDVLVYPRPSMRLTELVTPLKPLEAMALGKAILGSGVGGIRLLIDPEVTGLLFEPGNMEDFCNQAARLLLDDGLRQALGERARTKVCEEKDWKSITSRYASVYETAIRNLCASA